MLTYSLTCAFVILLAVYYLVLKQKSLIRTLLKYRDLNPITLLEVTSHLPRNKTSKSEGPPCEEVRTLKSIYEIPGPVILPVIGTRWQFYFKYSLPKVHEAYRDMYQRFGEIVLEVGNGHPYLHLFNRQDIEKAMRSHSKYPFRPPLDIVIEYRRTRPDRYASFGLAQEQGETWHSLRAHLTPALSSMKVLNRFLPQLEDIADAFVDIVREKRDANGVIQNFRGVINLFGLEALAGLILNKRLGLLEPTPDLEILELANAVQQIFIVFRDVFYGSGMWKYLPSKTWKDFVKNEEYIYSKISDIVDKSMAEVNVIAQDDSSASIHEQILSSPLDIRDKKSGLIDLLTAGIQTLATTLSIFLYHISRNPECQQKIKDELQAGIHRDNLMEATYTKACIQEAYRLNPAAFAIARLQEEDLELSGYHVKSGTLVICHTMIACQQENNFSEATRFIPERWIPDSSFWNLPSKPNHSPTLVRPFGSGRRQCPGKRFSQQQLLMVIAKLVQNFEIEYLGELDLVCDFLLGPRDVNVRFTDRVTG